MPMSRDDSARAWLPYAKRQNIRRMFLRSTGRSTPTPTGEAYRVSSFPFVSGDTFRLLADIVLDRSTRPEQVPNASRDDEFVFVEADFWLKGPGIDWVVDWLNRCERNRPPRVILHNGDATPSTNKLLQLRDASRSVWSVNVGDDIPGVNPLPIGLENAHHRRNGCVGEFLGDLRSPRSRDDRSIAILAAFDISTNRAVRAPLASAAAASRHGWREPTMPPQTFRDAVRASRFVLSPPGNGNDCHRTWEALYLGAIPIVQAGSLAPSICEQLPILVLSDMRAALDLSPKELYEVERTLGERRLDSAMMKHWILRLHM